MRTLKITPKHLSLTVSIFLSFNYKVKFCFLIPLLFLTPILITSCTHSSDLDNIQKQKYAKEGAMIVSEARGYLNTQLYRFLTKGDVKSAIIGACRLSVTDRIDRLAVKKNVKIKRISSLSRNPMNSPSAIESDELKKYQNLTRNSAASKVIKNGNKVVYLSPIYVDGTCLKCHGEQGLTLDEDAIELTRSLYPEDKAIGYKDGDFRGLWTVTFFDEKW